MTLLECLHNKRNRHILEQQGIANLNGGKRNALGNVVLVLVEHLPIVFVEERIFVLKDFFVLIHQHVLE